MYSADFVDRRRRPEASKLDAFIEDLQDKGKDAVIYASVIIALPWVSVFLSFC